MMSAAESEPAAAPALQQAQRRRPFSDEAFVKRIAECKLVAREDVLVILRDAGINFYLDESDETLKRELSELEVTLLCIHGNHEKRPSEIPSYEEVGWNGALVYAEPEFPNLFFAKDGEIYHLEGRTAMAIGGAYSIDKYYRLANRLPWFESEQPDDAIEAFVEVQLDRADWQVDYIFFHTVPLRYEPRHAFLDSKTVQSFILEDGRYSVKEFGTAGDKMRANVLENCIIDLSGIFPE